VLMLGLGSIDMRYWEITSPWSAPWNPIAVVLPYGAFVLLCAQIGGTGWRWLPGVVALHGFLAQTHAGCALVATGGLLACLGHLGLSWHRRPSPEHSRRLWIGLSTLVLCCVWLLPVLDQLAGNGNLVHVLRHAVSPRAFGFGRAVVHTALHTSHWGLPLVAQGPYSVGYQTASLVVATVQLLLLVWGYRWARNCDDPFGARLISILAFLFCLSFLAAWRLDNERYFYLTFWLPMQSALVWAVVVATYVQAKPVSRLAVLRGIAAVAVVTTCMVSIAHVRLLVDNVATASFVTWKSATVAAMVGPAASQIKKESGTSLREPEGGGVLVGLLLELVKHGLRPVVAQPWCGDLGPRVACAEPSNPELVVRRDPTPSCQQLVRYDSLSLCLERR